MNSQYKFNGKEMDGETGYYYYGARYYNPRVSLWLNVDPLAEKHPDFSPYTYCANNPLNLTDPNGKDWFLDDKKHAYVYDKSLTSVEQFNKLVENGLVEGHYIGKGGIRSVRLGNEEIGKVNLYEDGSWLNMTNSDPDKFEYHDVNGPELQRGQYFANYPNSERNWGVQIFDDPWSLSVSLEATPITGGIELGYFNGNYDRGLYFNLYGSAGLSAGLGFNYNTYESINGPITIHPEGDNSIKGSYTNFQGGIGPFSYSQGGNGDLGVNYQSGYKTKGGAVSKGLNPAILFNLKAKAGGSYQTGTTYILYNSSNKSDK